MSGRCRRGAGRWMWRGPCMSGMMSGFDARFVFVRMHTQNKATTYESAVALVATHSCRSVAWLSVARLTAIRHHRASRSSSA